MTETLYSWVESLVCYYILLSAVTNFLPDNSFKNIFSIIWDYF